MLNYLIYENVTGKKADYCITLKSNSYKMQHFLMFLGSKTMFFSLFWAKISLKILFLGRFWHVKSRFLVLKWHFFDLKVYQLYHLFHLCRGTVRLFRVQKIQPNAFQLIHQFGLYRNARCLWRPGLSGKVAGF